jgi:hypothetical protein
MNRAATRPANGFERLARSNKVLKLVAEIDRRCPTVPAARMADHLRNVFTVACWDELAKQAGVTTPSTATVALVIEAFELRASRRVAS